MDFSLSSRTPSAPGVFQVGVIHMLGVRQVKECCCKDHRVPWKRWHYSIWKMLGCKKGRVRR